MVELGYNPMGGARLWQRFVDQPKPQNDLLGEFLQATEQVLTESLESHPPKPSRICTALEVAKEFAQRHPSARLYDGKSNLKQLL